MTETRKPLADSSADGGGKHRITRGAVGQAGKGDTQAGKGDTVNPAKRIHGGGAITPEERWNMIAVAAYYRAEQRGFIGGSPAKDWTAAEEEIDSLLGGDKFQW
uniref:DUF2934 domain-containing protein n=1 Tax=Candidatus Kentrum sp. DK TaxID=2126562 RepID=A0A450TDH6_9GAMM|nr:MAG: Protein of unknown function (DUF2934) [Candidatus Kentron sp. DK]VFJ64999.1 MAG: Protein of unknown function (DUF2934) [Candidatus Kentron sp. DK]